MFKELAKYAIRPELYAPGTKNIWEDDHVSKGMLEAHLNPDWDAATRKHVFLDRSVNWITSIAPPSQHKCLLDLGCGPGLYAERFSRAGYSVTGIDFSKRSIAYANEQTLLNSSNITYLYQNYMTIDYKEKFDVITLIYCDYAVLSKENRNILMKKVYQSLNPGGKFFLDVFTPIMRKEASHSWHYNYSGGFWSDKPHMCLESVYQYEDEDRTELRQFIILTEDNIDCYNIWDHFFTRDALQLEAQEAGFSRFDFYGDVAGKEFSDTSETICGVFTK